MVLQRNKRPFTGLHENGSVGKTSRGSERGFGRDLSGLEPLPRSRRREQLFTTNHSILGVQGWGGEIERKFNFHLLWCRKGRGKDSRCLTVVGPKVKQNVFILNILPS